MGDAKRAAQELTQLDFGAMIYTPLKTAAEVQNEVSKRTMQFLKRFALNGSTLKTFDIEVDLPTPTGSLMIKRLALPVICMLPIPIFKVESLTISFSATISGTTTEAKGEHSSLEVEVGAGGAKGSQKENSAKNADVNISASFSQKETKKKGRSIKMDYTFTIEVTAQQANIYDVTPGMKKLQDLLAENVSNSINNLMNLPDPEDIQKEGEEK
mmetsp:Transcript_53092/g.133442  ORF Transcript_53092/g.133442 Transcript_53092/m.133442 type:complete len:213 (+) Transcript_53092:83-721(+)